MTNTDIPAFKTVQTLRINHPDHDLEPSYLRLLSLECDPSEQWHLCGSLTYPDEQSNESTAWMRRAVFYRFADRAGCTLASLAESGIYPLPDLKRVCMTANGDQIWATEPDDEPYARDLAISVLPFALLNTPSVDHYCQTSLCGPLALRSAIYAVDYPPRIATFHPVCPPLRSWHQELPTIVLGATNRYMFPQHHRSWGPDEVIQWLHEQDLTDRIFDPLIATLSRDRGVSVFDPSCLHRDLPMVLGPSFTQRGLRVDDIAISDSDGNGTIIELYNYVRRYPIVDGESVTGACDPWLGPLPECDLAPLPAILDSLLIPMWRGKVVLKNLEDCPPCSACDGEGHWASEEQGREIE
jgi:hypothetical protein